MGDFRQYGLQMPFLRYLEAIRFVIDLKLIITEFVVEQIE